MSTHLAALIVNTEVRVCGPRQSTHVDGIMISPQSALGRRLLSIALCCYA
jgi:hypothetical protein